MKLYKGSLMLQILVRLNSTGPIPRKKMKLYFEDSYDYIYYTKSMKKLIDAGYVEVYRNKRLNYIRITESGMAALLGKSEDPKAVKRETVVTRDKQEEKRQQLVNDVKGLCAACGIKTDEASGRVDIERLLTKEVEEETEREFLENLDTGIFYTTGELRKAYKERYGENEIANWTRLVGVVLRNHTISYVYGVNDSLIKWLPVCESRTVDFIQRMLGEVPVISKAVQLDQRPNSIICGKSWAMIPKLVYGRKSGSNKEEDGVVVNGMRAKNARDHINAYNLAKVYSSAFYASVNDRGVSAFNLGTLLSDETREALCDRYFAEREDATRLKSVKGNLGVTKTGERVYYMPCVDLIELERIKNQGKAGHVVCQKGTQEGIARVLGPLMISVRDLEGNLLEYGSYDKNGNPLDRKE